MSFTNKRWDSCDKLYLLNHTILGKTCYINAFLSKKERKDRVLILSLS